MKIHERIYNLRKEKGLTLEDVGNFVGVGKSTVRKWETGMIANMKRDKIAKLAQCLGVTPAVLLGYDSAEKYPTVQVHSLPIIGKITAGYNGLATEDYTNEYQEIPSSIINGYSMEDLFVLEVTGNSMYPQFLASDRVLVHRQSSVDSGDVAVVLYDFEEATIKQVRYVQGEDWLELIPRNPEFPVKRIEGADLEQCRVLGKVIYLFRKI